MSDALPLDHSSRALYGWMPPDSSGYYCVGYDRYVSTTAPVWFAHGDDALARGASWVAAAAETEGRRRVIVYHAMDDGTVQGPDFVMETAPGATDDAPFDFNLPGAS